MRRICGILGVILLVFLIAQPAAGTAAPDTGVGTAVPSLMLEAGGSTGTHAFVASLAGVTPEKRVQAPSGGQNRWLMADDGGNGGDDDGGGEDFDDDDDGELADEELAEMEAQYEKDLKDLLEMRAKRDAGEEVDSNVFFMLQQRVDQYEAMIKEKGGDTTKIKERVKPPEVAEETPQDLFPVPNIYKQNLNDPKVVSILENAKWQIYHRSRDYLDALNKIREHASIQRESWTREEALKYQADLEELIKDAIDKQEILALVASVPRSPSEEILFARFLQEEAEYKALQEKIDPIQEKIDEQYANKADYENELAALEKEWGATGKGDLPRIGVLRMGLKMVNAYIDEWEGKVAPLKAAQTAQKTKMDNLKKEIKQLMFSRGVSNLQRLLPEDKEFKPMESIKTEDILKSLLGESAWEAFKLQAEVRTEATGPQ